jgi:transcriptional regulator
MITIETIHNASPASVLHGLWFVNPGIISPMYIPAPFAETDPARLHNAIERYSFAMLVSNGLEGLSASHLPLMIDRARGASGTLLGHMARANLQWQEAAGHEVLAIFSGPHAYISPQWYEAPQVVPTWNYVAVHAYGRLDLIEDEAEVEALLHRTIQTYEGAQPHPWRLNESAEFVQRLLRQIVAFRIPITRLEGKWKLNQNRPQQQRTNVIAALARQPDDNAQEIAQWMRELPAS